MHYLLFAAALRKDSVNKKLINLAANKLQEKNIDVDLADFAEFDMPLYHGDIQVNEGIPAGAIEFTKRMQQATGVIISSPEYNFSIPGTLKNLIDWVSRINPMPWKKQHILLLSASPALVGGNRGLWATRIPLEGCGAFVYPDMFSLASAYDAFNDDGSLKDASLQKRLEDMLGQFTEFAAKNK
jgi:NAD(P)H-dependent FMN reductase